MNGPVLGRFEIASHAGDNVVRLHGMDDHRLVKFLGQFDMAFENLELAEER